MTRSQLDVLAQAPCTSTMVGFGVWLAVAAVLIVWADAVWPSGTSSAAEPAAVQTAAAAMRLSRKRVRRRVRMMFMRPSLAGYWPYRDDLVRPFTAGRP